MKYSPLLGFSHGCWWYNAVHKGRHVVVPLKWRIKASEFQEYVDLICEIGLR